MFERLSKVFIVLYLLHHVIPYLGVADKVHIQTLYLSCLNLVSIIFLFSTKSLTNLFNKSFYSIPVFVFFCFFLWSFVAIIPAMNYQESLIQIAYYFVQLVCFTLILGFLYNIKTKFYDFIRFLIVLVVIVEITPSFYNYILDVVSQGFPNPRSLIYRGTSGNVNILAFSLLFKLPFLYYYILKSKSNFLYVIIATLLIFVVVNITKTRAAIITLVFLSLIYFSFLLLTHFIKTKNFVKISRRQLIFSFLPLLIAFLTDIYLEERIYKNSDIGLSNSINRIASLADGDYSTDSRFRYYTQAIQSIIENPLLGIGTGNWELISVDKESKNMQGYIIPYHVHNDFLEITAESGLIGGFLYFFVIFFVIYLLLRKLLFQINLNKDYFFSLILILSLGSYSFDALFNFPSARPLQQINLFFVLSISIVYLGHRVKNLINFKRVYFLYFILTLIPLSIYSAILVVESSKEQKVLLQFFNSSGQMPIERDFIENVKSGYPNLTVTTIPIKSVQGVYHFNQGEFEKAIPLLKEGAKLNPFLGVSQAFLGKSYYELDSIDQSLFWIKDAYENIPNNDLHISEYLKVLARVKDSVTLKEVFKNIRDKKLIHDELYLLAMAAVTGGEQSLYAFEGLDIYPESNNDQAAQGYYALKIGYKDMLEAATQHLIAEKYYEEKKFTLALPLFRSASILNPYEIPYRENYANTLLQLNFNVEAIDEINKIADDNNDLTTKAIYIRAIAYLSIDDKRNGCIDLKNLLNNNEVPLGFYENFCK